jgi:predicted ATPase/DNA-binding MarR family transcriptional regulator
MILLLLSEFYKYTERDILPQKISQSGISGSLGINRPNVTKELIKLKKMGNVDERMVRLDGVKRRKKGYFITNKGLDEAKSIREQVKAHRITYIDIDGNRSDVSIEDIGELIGNGMLFAEVVSRISDNGTLDIRLLEGEEGRALHIPEPEVSKFVGRKNEIAYFKSLNEEVPNGKGRCILVSGEAGVGKTRFVEKAIGQIKAGDVVFLHGKCLYQTDVDPYLPFIDALDDYLQSAEQSIKEEVLILIESKAQEFSGILPFHLAERGISVRVAEKDMNIESERTRILDAICQAFIKMSEKKPVIIFIDDMQWADKGSLHLFQYIARNVKENSILLIGAYRPEDLIDKGDRPHPLKDLIVNLKVEGILSEIGLKRLDYEESREMIINNPQGIHIPEEFASFICRESDGNPFYIEELLTVLDKDSEGGIAFEIETPRSIRDIITRRIRKMDYDERELLEVCSVMGEMFDVDGLLDIIDRDDEEIIDSIGYLCNARFIDDIPSGENVSYRFHHCKIQEVIYEDMNKVKRRLIHEKIARNLEDSNKDNLNDIVNELAHHYQNTKEYSKIFEYSLKAGDKANSVYSYEEALSHYKTALIALENIRGTIPEIAQKDSKEEDKAGSDEKFAPQTDGRPAEYNEHKKALLKKIGIAYKFIGHWDDSIHAFSNQLELTEDAKIRAQIASYTADCYISKRWYNKAITICEEAIDSLPDDCMEKCDLLSSIGSALWHKGNFEKAYEYYQLGFEVAERIEDERAKAVAYNDLAKVFNFRNEHSKAIEYCKRALEIWKKLGNRRFAGMVNNNLGCCYVENGKIKEAIDCFGESMQYFKEIGDELTIATINYNLGNLYHEIEDFEGAIAVINECIRTHTKVARLDSLAGCWYRLGMIYIDMEEIDKAVMYLEKSLEVCKKINVKQRITPSNYQGLAICEIERGNLSKALEYCEQALEASRNLGTIDVDASIFIEYGRIYTKMGAWESAINSFQKSLSIFNEIEGRRPLGIAHYYYGMMWKEKGDKENATKHLNFAKELFAKSELNKRVEKINEELEKLKNS